MITNVVAVHNFIRCSLNKKEKFCCHHLFGTKYLEVDFTPVMINKPNVFVERIADRKGSCTAFVLVASVYNTEHDLLKGEPSLYEVVVGVDNHNKVDKRSQMITLLKHMDEQLCKAAHLYDNTAFIASCKGWLKT